MRATPMATIKMPTRERRPARPLKREETPGVPRAEDDEEGTNGGGRAPTIISVAEKGRLAGRAGANANRHQAANRQRPPRAPARLSEIGMAASGRGFADREKLKRWIFAMPRPLQSDRGIFRSVGFSPRGSRLVNESRPCSLATLLLVSPTIPRRSRSFQPQEGEISHVRVDLPVGPPAHTNGRAWTEVHATTWGARFALCNCRRRSIFRLGSSLPETRATARCASSNAGSMASCGTSHPPKPLEAPPSGGAVAPTSPGRRDSGSRDCHAPIPSGSINWSARYGPTGTPAFR